MKEKFITAMKITAVTAAALYCLTQPAEVKDAVSAGSGRCLSVLIPSLYAMMIVSVLLTKTGILSAASMLPAPLTLPFRMLTGLPGNLLPVYTFSMFAGYPVGMKLLSERCAAGELSRRSAAVLAGICFGPGPAFVYGCASSQLFGTPSVGRLILLSVIAGNLLVTLLLSPLLRRMKIPGTSGSVHIRLDSEVLSEAVCSGGASMAQLCFTVTAFAVISAMLGRLGISGAAADMMSAVTGRPASETLSITAALLDVTAVTGLPHGDFTLLPAVTALISFGGICVFFQLSAVSSGKISVIPAMLIRTAAAAASCGICRAAMPFFIAGETVSAAVTAGFHKAPSVIPSIMLIFMTIMVMDQWKSSPEQQKSHV